MKKVILILLCVFSAFVADAQVNLNIGPGAYIVANGSPGFVMDTGSMVNNGAYIDSTGAFIASGGITFSGSGTTHFNNFTVNNAQHSTVNSLVSVYNTAGLVAGNLNANNNLYIRSDANGVANMVVAGVLTNNVQGIIVRATVTSGACPSYTAALSLNISGPVVSYQWQSSPDSATWGNLGGAVSGAYTATVIATTYYRCNLTATNSAYSESTPGIKLLLTGSLPNAGAVNGAEVVCVGATASLSDAVGGGAWSGTGSASVGSTGIVTGVTGGTATISYTVTNSCGSTSATAQVTVNSLPGAGTITGIATVCAGAATNLTDVTGGGAWGSGATGIATVSSTGIVTGIASGTAKISYTVTNSCGSAAATQTVTVNTTSAGTVSGSSGVTVGSDIMLTDAVSGGTWSASNTNAIVSGGLVTGESVGTVTISYAVTGSCGAAYATKVITVANSSISGISGNTGICAGGTAMLTDATTGGTWGMGSLVATINGSTGVVTASNAYAGTATVTYTVGAVSVTIVITVNSNPTPIQGATAECAGTIVTLTDATAGGAWSGAGDAAISGTGSSGTLIAGTVGGTAMVTYTLATGCMAAVINTVYSSPLPITGVFNVCIGSVTNLTDASPVASWSSGNPAVAVASGPDVTGESAGTAIITFTSGSAGNCITTQIVNVSAQPAAISGNTGILCPGATLSLADGSGLWASSNTAVAAVGSASGVVTGGTAGTATITYAASGASGCVAKTIVTVSAVPTISGTAKVCIGGTTALTDAVAGGTWGSGSATVTVSAAGVVTGVAGGTATITYTTAGGCIGALTVTVSAASASISGNLFLCVGATTTLSDAGGGGTWGMSGSIASVVGSTGVVTASATLTGTATISYTSGGCSATAILTVNAKPMPIQGATAECAGATITLTDVTAGGTWSGAGAAIVSGVGSSGILVAGVTGGTATVTYTIGVGCTVTAANTVYASPQPIMGNFNLCVGLVTNLSDASPVSSWSSSSTAIAIASGADISGEGVGTATITFKTSAAGNCITTQVVTVNAMPVVTVINGPASIPLIGSPVSVSDATAGGIWTSSNTSVITLGGSTGSPIAATALMATGSSIITYAVTISGCTTKVTKTFSASAISHPAGTATVFAGSVVGIADDVVGGMWGSSDNGIATVDANGLVAGIMPGNLIITHEATGDDGAVTTNVINVTVKAIPASISLVPNPNKGTFVVKGTLGSMANEEVTLEVTDMLGQVIYRNKIAAEGGRLDATIVLGNVPANGTYILNVLSGTENKTFHFVIGQ